MKITIKKGSHYTYSVNRFLNFFTRKKSLEYSVVFDASCRYATKHSSNQWDINKLFGFTDGLRTVHEESARFGWRYVPGLNLIELYSYCYINGMVYKELLVYAGIHQEVVLRVDKEEYDYVFYVGGKRKGVWPRANPANHDISFMCWPYFGGDETAPHDITITLNPVK